MTVLALKTCRRANAVSSLHGHVSRAMWTSLYPGAREDHVPIGHITNGVHVQTWLAPPMRQVYDAPPRAPTGRSAAARTASGTRIDSVDDGELWEAHQALKGQLIEFTRRRIDPAGRASRRVAASRSRS